MMFSKCALERMKRKKKKKKSAAQLTPEIF